VGLGFLLSFLLEGSVLAVSGFSALNVFLIVLLKYKARLTAKGFSQVPGVDFGETFAPTIRTETMRTVFALCAEIGLDAIVFHWDIIGAYLWSKLDEEIYMDPPPGCKLPKGFDCLLLIMALYGLKQSGRLW